MGAEDVSASVRVPLLVLLYGPGANRLIFGFDGETKLIAQVKRQR